MASLISSMAAHDNLAAADLAQSLQAMLAAVSSRSRVQQEMLLMLTEMQADKPEMRLPPSATLAQLLAFLKERRVSEELMQAVRHYARQAGNEERYSQLIMACLGEDRPIDFEELLIICAEKTAESPPKQNQRAGFGQPASLSLAQLLALLKERRVSEELMQAVRQYAGQVSDEKRSSPPV